MSYGNPPTKQSDLKVEFSPIKLEEVLHEEIPLYRQSDHRRS